MTNKPTFNDPYRLPQKRPVIVTLVCGCKIDTRDQPARKTTKYPCPNGLGHGYQVMWTKWEYEGRSGVNDQAT